MLKRFVAGALASYIFLPATAAEIGVAAFNLAWAGTEADFSKHIEVCTAPTVKWCDSRPKKIKGEEPTKDELARAAKCQAAFAEVAGGAEQAQQVAPCNAYKLTAKKWAAGPNTMYQQKLQGLRGTFDALVTEHQIAVFAIQEVKSEETIRAALGAHAASFEVCVAPHNAFQTVGFAWRRSLGKGACTAQPSLSVTEDPTTPTSIRKVRPGLELVLSIDGKLVTFLNVHLKSGCASLNKDSYSDGNLLTSDEAACKVLNRQVVPLENWIEDVAKRSPLFVVLGDFNRKLDEEEKANVSKNQVRADGTFADKPNKTDANGSVTSKYLWQEISDGDPSLVQVPLSKSMGCKGFEGLDHILLSQDLGALQKAPTSSKVPVKTMPNQVVETSDHCPRVTKISL